jgi:hypothetical protein
VPRRAARLPRRADTCARTSAFLLVMAVAPALAWLLHHAAEYAYASQVNNTSTLLSVRVRSHAFFGGHGSHIPAGPPVNAAPFAFAHQLAHALQDGLAGQAAGLPVAFAALLSGTRRPRPAPTPGRHQQAET